MCHKVKAWVKQEILYATWKRQPFYRQTQIFKCYGIQAQAEKNDKLFGPSRNELNSLIEKKFQKFVTNKKRKKRGEKVQNFQEL